MKRSVLFIVALLGSLACFSQQLPTKQQQYEFLKWYLKTDPPQKLSNRLDHFNNEYFSLTEFDDLKDQAEVKASGFKVTEADITFIKNQLLKNNKVKKIEKDSLKNIDWHNWDDPDLPITHISLPVFSSDGNTVFINRYFHCGGLCGNGRIEIYRNVKGEWQRFPVMWWARWNN